MGNGYGDYINSQYKKDKKPKIYKTTGSEYNKTEVKERAAIRSQIANDVAYWEQKRGKKSDRQKDHVAIAENYYKNQERRKEVNDAGQKRLKENKGKGKYSQEDRLQEYKDVRDKNRKSESKEYEKRIGEWATSDFKKQNNYGANKGLVESDVRFRSYMDKQKDKKGSVAQSLIPEFAPKKKKEKSFLDKIFDTVKGDKPSTPTNLNLNIRDGGSRKPKGKFSDSLQKSSDSVGKFNSNAVNKATGSLWENSILPMMEAFDDKDKKPSEKLKDLFTGNLGDGKEREYELAKPDSKGARIASDLLGYGLGGAGVGKALRTVGLGANTSAKALSTKGAFERGKEGAAIGALMSGTEVGSREVGRPNDYNWKQNLGQIGIETAGGAILDPLLAAGGAKLLNKLGQKPKGKIDFDDVAELESSELPFTMNEPQLTVKPMQQTVERMAATTSKPRHDVDTLMKSYKGQNVNSIPIQPRQSKPMPSEPLDRKLPYWRNKNNPIDEQDVADIYRHVQEVESKMIKLKDPNNPEYQKIVNDHSKRDPNFNAKRVELDKRRAVLEDVMNREQEWKSVKESQEAFATKNRPEEMKFIVPIDERLDYEAVPKRFRGSNNTASMDIHEAASVAGYDSVDDYVRYLQGVDNLLSKTRNDFKLPPSKQVATLVQNESRLAKEVDDVISKITNRRADESLIEELSDLMTPRKGAAITKIDDMPSNPYKSIVQASAKKLDENGKPIKINKNQKFKDLANKAIVNSDLWEDKGPLRYGRETLERNFEDIANKADGQFLKDNYVQPIRQKETERIRYVNTLRDNVKKLGIKPKSKDDQLTQMYGEKKISLENLQKETPNWEKVKQASEWHLNNYKNIIGTVNKILDDAGEPTIPILENYFPHYQEVDGIFAKLKKAGFNVENNTLPTGINGLTENFKPNKKFFSHALRRTTDETTFGAIEGFDRYIEGVSQLMYHTENIKNVRALENAIREKHGDTTHLTNLVPYLKEHGNLMAGKKANIDRVIEEKVGRKAYNALDTLKQRTGMNMLGYSVSSATSAFIPLTQAAATTKPTSFIKGMTDTITNIVRNDGFADKSGFLTRRVGSKPLVRTTWNKIENNSMLMMDMVDRFTSQTIVRGKYNELIDKGLPEDEALRQADDWAGRVMTDRSKGQQPTMFNAKTLGPLLQFQVEVNNQLSFIFKDIPKNAKNKAQLASQMTQVLVYSYLYNQVAEQILGRRPAFDPAGVAEEAYRNFTNEEMDNKESTGKFLKEVAGQLPFTSTFTGGRYPITSAVPSLNIDDYAQGKTTVGKEAMKPLKYLVLPAGGSQINKTYQGNEILQKEGVYTNKGDLRYPVEKNTGNILKGLVLGKSSFPETKEFYDKPFNQRRSLGTNQTKEYEYAKSKGLGKEFYDDTILKRTENGKKNKVKAAMKEIEKIEKDNTLTDKEQEKRINKIMKSIGQ